MALKRDKWSALVGCQRLFFEFFVTVKNDDSEEDNG